MYEMYLVQWFSRDLCLIGGWGGGGSSAIGICALCYIYLKHMWFNGFLKIYAGLEEGDWGQSAMGICALCYIYLKVSWCNGFPKIYACLEEGAGVNLLWVYVHCAIYIYIYIYEIDLV